MQVNHNAGAKVQFGDYSRPVNIAFDSPLPKRFKGKHVLDLNSDSAVQLVANKPALFRRLSEAENVPLPEWKALKSLEGPEGFDYPMYEETFPTGTIMRGREGSKTLPTIGDLIDFLVEKKDSNYVAISRPEHFRYGSVSICPRLHKRVPYGVINASINTGSLPQDVMVAAAAAVAAAGVDYAQVTFFLITGADGVERPCITDISTRFSMADAEGIAQLIRHSLGISK